MHMGFGFRSLGFRVEILGYMLVCDNIQEQQGILLHGPASMLEWGLVYCLRTPRKPVVLIRAPA